MKIKKVRIFNVGLVVLILLNIIVIGNEKLEADVLSLDNFKKIVILENGRKKPFDTFAQNILKQFSGKTKYQGKSAIHWLARVLFDPQSTKDDKVFLITNHEVLNSLGIIQKGKDRDRYSFSLFQPHLLKLRELAISVSKMNEKERSLVANEILLLYNKLYEYRQLMASFQVVIPQKDFSIKNNETKNYLDLSINRDHFSLFEIAQKRDKLEEVVGTLKNKNEEDWSTVEQELFSLDGKLKQFITHNQGLPLTILPVITQNEEKWLSPWDSLSFGYMHNSPIPDELFFIRDMVDAYNSDNQKKFDATIITFNKLIVKQSKGKLSPKKITLEILYNSLNPFIRSLFFYGFSLMALILSFIILKKWLYKFSFLLIIAGVLLHTCGIILRMIIRARPPVTNLYETFVFTALITVLLGITLEFFRKKNIGLLTGSISAIILLLIAGKYALEGDTMGMLMAVLNTNFWLAIHIITITVGFAGIVISGIIGHVYIFQKIFKADKSELLKNTYQAIYSTQAFGLVFTFIGTVLGGMWADQSWGRFWGWDPKENGALLIILWSAFLFHARLAKWIKELGFALGSIGGILTVVLTWFGINLLGVGLHSYGFTSKLAITLAIFVFFEVIFMLSTFFYIKQKYNQS